MTEPLHRQDFPVHSYEVDAEGLLAPRSLFAFLQEAAGGDAVRGGHIRTLLLTFFYRQMPDLLEKGYLYIAQPPLFKVKKGKTERYIQNEAELLAMLFELAADDVHVVTPAGAISGKKLIPHLKKISSYERLLGWFERKRMDRQIVEALLAVEAHHDAFKSAESLSSLLGKVTARVTGVVAGEVTFDEETGTYGVDVKRENYMTNVSLSLMMSPEFKEFEHLYRELVKSMGTPPYHVTVKGETREVARLVDLLHMASDVAKKGLTIQRYKGLGEMNPQQLWETTMDPDKRTLLQVSIEDSVTADDIFTVLMGDQVEPRKDFIHRHALEAKNIDI